MMEQWSRIDETLIEILLRHADHPIRMDEWTDNTDLINDLALDSISIVNLFVELEEEFKLMIEPADLERPILKKYRNLREFVMEKIAYGD